ncbi:MAG: LamG domain-containing protein [Janthinobacterium lividum]
MQIALKKTPGANKPLSGLLIPGLLAGATLGALGFTPPAAHAQNAYSQAVLAANPLAYFPLDSVNEGSVVNGFTTTFNGSATVTAPGGGAPILSDPSNVGASFNGTPDTSGFGTGPSISTSVGSANPTGASTMLGWFSLAQPPPGNGGIVNYYVAGRSQVGNDLDLQVYTDGRLYYFTAGGGYINTPTPLSLNQYYFFAATEDPATQIADLYLDGQLAATSTGDVSGSAHTSAFTIGDSSVFTPRNFDGSIDDVALYNYALTGEQVANIYASADVPAAVPEASTTVSFGLLLALGMGGVVIAARKKKAAAAV